MNSKLFKVFPKYTIIPLLLMIVMNVITYYGSQLYTTHLYHYNIASAIDYKIPFVSIFIVPYILAYAQWIIGYIVIARDSKKLCYWIILAELVSKTIILFIFIIFPTTIDRPIIESNTIFNWLTNMIYKSDAATNLFPSIHCLESFLVVVGTFKMKDAHPAYKWANLVLAILVFLSTVFVKQHVVIDIFGAFVVAIIGLWISKNICRGIKNV